MTFVNLLYVILIDYYAMYYKNDPNHIYLGCLIPIILILFCNELIEAKQSSIYGNIFNYFKDFSNWFDLSGLACMFIYCVLVQTGMPVSGRRSWLVFGVFLANMRLMYQLGVFSENFRLMVKIITASISNLKSFLYVLYFIIGTMAICEYVIDDQDEKETFETLF